MSADRLARRGDRRDAAARRDQRQPQVDPDLVMDKTMTLNLWRHPRRQDGLMEVTLTTVGDEPITVTPELGARFTVTFEVTALQREIIEEKSDG